MAENLKIIYCLYPNKKEASKTARLLLQKKLIVCANILPVVESHYEWKNKTQKSREVAVYFKTLPRLSRKARIEIERLHPYDVPLVGELLLSGVNASYMAYARSILRTT